MFVNGWFELDEWKLLYIPGGMPPVLELHRQAAKLRLHDCAEPRLSSADTGPARAQAHGNHRPHIKTDRRGRLSAFYVGAQVSVSPIGPEGAVQALARQVNATKEGRRDDIR
jgi:hypothetical protein